MKYKSNSSYIIRDSNFELLRLFAIFSVLMYHFISYYTINYSPDNYLGYISWLPFRTAVTLFVFVSGYYHIRFSIKGLTRIVAKTLIIFIPVEVIAYFCLGYGEERSLFKAMAECFMPLAKGPYWYIVNYLCLYLLSPVINKYLKEITWQRRLYLIVVLSFISIYLGLPGCVDELQDGKNLVHFILLYLIGDSLKVYEYRIRKIQTSYLVLLFLFINIGQLFVFYLFYDTVLMSFWFLVDRNNGPILIIDAIITFILFSRIHMRNKTINLIASSVLVMYIVQQEPYLRFLLSSIYERMWCPDYAYNFNGFEETIKVVGYLAVRAFFFMAVAFCIDRILQPVWIIVEKIADSKFGRINQLIAE